MKGTKKIKKPPAHRKAAPVWSDTKDYEFHPLAERFPLLEGDEFEQFADDIANGQKETVKLFEGKILDGRNRYRACKARGKPCRYENWNEEGDPGDYVLSVNLHRRHLSAEARRELVIQLRKEGKSIRQIADTLNTSVGTVHRNIEQATVPNGTLPNTIKGKDGKRRPARKPPGKKQSRKNGKKNSDESRGPRPAIPDLIGIIHRGLEAVDAQDLSRKSQSVLFRVDG